MKKIIVAMRGRYKNGGGTAQRLEPQLSGLCNTLTSEQKDNLILEIEDDRKREIQAATKAGVIKWRVGGWLIFLSLHQRQEEEGFRKAGGVCPTLMANNQDIFKLEADEMKKYRIRKLTPRECWRLMGFSDDDFEKAEAVNSNTQLYAQAGNSIVVNVLEAIFGKMINQEAAEEPEQTDKKESVVEVFKEKLMDSEKVQLYGSINSGNYMINIEDAVEILKQCVG